MLARQKAGGVISHRELKRLISIADQGMVIGWIDDLRESLSDLSEDALKFNSTFYDVKDAYKIAGENLEPENRNKIALILKRLIAFNNAANAEKKAFDSVGVGDCVFETKEHLKALKTALKLLR
ncbi:hypothetical protein V5279_36075 [Bradyrhizobium sp. 26S5]|uniref:hypothetical protein n=1 Tax=Bradyrhizobium sp. 26S5 TaxID=3139729 RepID=UPI0030D52AD3